MTPEQRIDRIARPLRTAVAGMAVTVGLLLLFRIPLVATFRAALVVLAAVEILGFGAAVASRRVGLAELGAITLKLAVLAGAYLALSS